MDTGEPPAWRREVLTRPEKSAYSCPGVAQPGRASEPLSNPREGRRRCRCAPSAHPRQPARLTTETGDPSRTGLSPVQNRTRILWKSGPRDHNLGHSLQTPEPVSGPNGYRAGANRDRADNEPRIEARISIPRHRHSARYCSWLDGMGFCKSHLPQLRR